MAHVAESKKKVVRDMVKLISDYPIIGAVNMENLPAPQLQIMRSQLRGKVQIFMSKRRLIKLAIDKCKDKKKDIEKLEGHLNGMPALIFTKDNPFALFKVLKKSKSGAPAKAGQTAPKDIVVKAGPTSFAPGPVIGELGAIGIKCGVEGGKVAIKEDSVVVKEGDKIGPKQAEILTRLGIEPMEVGLDLVATYEDGTIYTKDILDIDETEFNNKVNNAARWAVNLAVYTAYPTKDTINLLIGKAFNDAKAIGLEQNIIDEKIIDELVGKAERQMQSLKAATSVPVSEKEPKKEEAPKVEEKPKVEEAKKEAAPEPKKEVPKVEEPKKEVPKIEEPVKKDIPKVEEKKKPEAPKIEEPKKEEIPKVEEKKVEEAPKLEEPKKEEVPKIEEKTAEKEEAKIEEKEKEVIEEEKEIIEEEKKLEKSKEPKIETPEDKEVREAVKEEEEKVLEKKRIEKEKEFEDLESQKSKIPKKPEPQIKEEDTDKKVAEMVKKMKQHIAGEEPTAEKLVEEIKEEQKVEEVKVEEKPKEEVAPEPKKEVPKVEEKKEEDVPSTHDLAKKKREHEHKTAEELAKELIKKGSLRK